MRAATSGRYGRRSIRSSECFSTTPNGAPGRVLETEEPIHPPAAIRLPQQEGDVAAELRHALAARVAPGLLERAKLGRVIRRDATTRDAETQAHVAQREIGRAHV